MRLDVRTKILGGSAVLLILIAAVGLLAISSLGSVHDKAQAAYSDGLRPVEKLAALDTALIDKARAVTYGVVVAGQADGQTTVDSQIAADDATISASLADFSALPLTSDQAATLTDLQAQMADYQKLVDPIRTASRAGNSSDAAAQILAAASERAKVMADVSTLMTSVQNGAIGLNDQIGSTYACVAGVVASLLISGGISRGARTVSRQTKAIEEAMAQFTHCLEGLAENDLTRIYVAHVQFIDKVGSDEIGETAAGLNSLLGQIKKMVAAYEVSRGNLTSVIGEVKAAADSVTRTSQELDSASTQTGTATQQIASTISQVATGASDQAQAASETSASTQELTAMIAQVGAGAAETNKRVEQAGEAVQAAIEAVSRADRAGEEMQTFANRVHVALENGIEAVDQTSNEMRRIQAAVESTSVKVTDLGAKSDQIGAIVETIDDIAEQTNLLALNAAIEAARAGEQGKGFAVVADEVRKLAERSSRATKEIAALIAQVQQGTEEAVKAMSAGAAEVASGAELADQASASFKEINGLAEARNAVLTDMMAAVVEIRSLSSEVVSATDGIASIAAETNQSAALMSSAADVVSQSVASIAAISQENSASAEEVSAATEEMSAQAEEVVASAATLAEMAQQLDELVARFRLGSGDAAVPVNVIPRRRASDWQVPTDARRVESA